MEDLLETAWKEERAIFMVVFLCRPNWNLSCFVPFKIVQTTPGK